MLYLVDILLALEAKWPTAVQETPPPNKLPFPIATQSTGAVVLPNALVPMAMLSVAVTFLQAL